MEREIKKVKFSLQKHKTNISRTLLYRASRPPRKWWQNPTFLFDAIGSKFLWHVVEYGILRILSEKNISIFAPLAGQRALEGPAFYFDEIGPNFLRYVVEHKMLIILSEKKF